MTISAHPDLQLAFPDQRLIVTYEDHVLDPVALGALADGWVHRSIPRSFARCDPDQLGRHVFEVVRERVLELGNVDLDAT